MGIGFCLSYELFLISVRKQEKKAEYYERKMKLWNNISYRVKNAGETSFNEMPIGIIVFDGVISPAMAMFLDSIVKTSQGLDND